MTIPGPATSARGSTAWKRVATSIVAIPLLVWVLLAGSPWIFRVIVLVAAGAAAWELLTMLERGGRHGYRRLGMGLAVAVTASFLVPGAAVPALAGACALTLAVPVVTRRVPEGEPAAVTLFALTYVAWLLGHALLLHGLGFGVELFTPTFAISRVSGWIAHAFEQRRANRIIRPQSEYVGPRDRRWRPVAER